MTDVLDRLDAAGLHRRRSVIGANIRAARELAGMTQAQLARQIGRSRVLVNRYEAAVSEPNDMTLTAIAHALDVTIDDLLTVR